MHIRLRLQLVFPEAQADERGVECMISGSRHISNLEPDLASPPASSPQLPKVSSFEYSQNQCANQALFQNDR